MVHGTAALGKRGRIGRVYLLVQMGLWRVLEDIQPHHEDREAQEKTSFIYSFTSVKPVFFKSDMRICLL